MTLEYLEIMEDMKSDELRVKSAESASPRRKLERSFKSNTRIYDDGSIEVDPQAQGQPSQKDVKKVGKSKRYSTTGKNPLTCVELKCPEDTPDKAAFFQKELAKLTKDIAIKEPKMPKGEYLLNKDNVKVCLRQQEGRVMVWFNIETQGALGVRKQLYSLTSEIDKCFAFNEDLVCQQK